MKKEFKIIIVFLLAIIFITGCGAKELKEKREEIKCEKGYELTESKCIKILDQKEAIASYSCQDGFTLSKDKSECTKTETKNAKIDNPCPSDYTFSNGKCSKTSKVAVTVTKTCLDGGRIAGNECEYIDIQSNGTIHKYKLHALMKKSCPSGYKNGANDGDWCVKTETIGITGTYYCDSDFTLNGTKCTKTSVEKPNITYSCESEEYTLKDKVCIQYEEKEAIIGS